MIRPPSSDRHYDVMTFLIMMVSAVMFRAMRIGCFSQPFLAELTLQSALLSTEPYASSLHLPTSGGATKKNMIGDDAAATTRSTDDEEPQIKAEESLQPLIGTSSQFEKLQGWG
ncbi:unnamed protein product [Cylindrotheca closterium]|uniref:Uncharacterized protein n=1 Tax=Cylindrotheca closterium TaxID=2856 RepID=A0AAD2G7C2_9STRA|nr:unnamed protein product [Cylindrotheca closterium]